LTELYKVWLGQNSDVIIFWHAGVKHLVVNLVQ
jgi:hypothetical protein